MSDVIARYLSWSQQAQLNTFLLVGLMLLAAVLGSGLIRALRLPSIVGTLLMGITLGPSLFNLVPADRFDDFSFIPEVALALVAINLGLEFNLATVRRLGAGVVVLILCESLLTFAVICIGVMLLTGDLVLALVAGAVGAASAPTGPVAVVQEKHARGKLTSTIFAVVGFDDAVGIFIFSFAHAFSRHLLIQRTPGIEDVISKTELLLSPFKEIGLSLAIGLVAGLLFVAVARRSRDRNALFLWLFAFVFLLQGLAYYLTFSTILANMMLGMIVVNLCNNVVTSKINLALEQYMPLVFALFFVFTGIQLDLRLLPSIGMLGLVFLLCRGGGKLVGSFAGAALGRLGRDIRGKIWMGLLSQIGVGTGLTLIIIQDFAGISEAGGQLGYTLLAVITATSLFFELVGPWLTQWALQRSGEIPKHHHASR